MDYPASMISLNLRACMAAFAVLFGSALLQPLNAQTVSEAATQKIQSQDFQGAASLLQQELRAHPRDPALWNLLGIAESELHHIAAAKDAFAQGLKLAPQSASLHENLGLLFFREGSYRDAQVNLERAVSLGSDKPGVRFSLAAAMLRDGHPAESLAALKMLEQPLSASPEYWEERGRAELLVDPSAAEHSFGQALALSPDSAAALNGAAAASEKQGFEERALALLIKARQAHPDDLETLHHFAMLCLRRDLGPDAITALEHARAENPQDNSTLYLLARANISVENWQKAYDLFSEFARRVPSFAPTYFALGWLDIKLNKVDEARRQLQHCLSLASNLTDARFELAQLDLNDGHLDTAQRLFEAVLRQDPNHAKANLAMGDLMMRRGDLQQAQTFLEKATHLDPQLASAHYKLSMVYFREHRSAEAERERSLAASLTAEDARQSKRQLKLVLPEDEAAH